MHDSVKSAIANQIPSQYYNIVTILAQSKDDTNKEIQTWVDNVLNHIEDIDANKMNSDKARRPIAFQTQMDGLDLTHNRLKIICQLCNEPGHTAKVCPLLKRSGVGCRYCKQLDHELKDCPKAKAKDAARAKYGSSSSKDLKKAYQAALRREQECENDDDEDEAEESEEEEEAPRGGLISISDSYQFPQSRIRS